MPLVKKIQKVGNAGGVVLNAETMSLLGVEPGTAVVLEIIGDTLLVRRLDANPPSEWQVLAGLQSMRDAVLVPKDGAILIESRQRALLILRAFGPLSPGELAGRVGLGVKQARNTLRGFVVDGYALEADGAYWLNQAAFKDGTVT